MAAFETTPMFRGVGVGLPAGDDIGDNAMDHLLDRAREARDTGLASVWFSQRLDHDALSVAAAVGAVVPEIGIGTAVVPLYPRHPIVASSQAQTAQAASHGRFTLGLGLGARALMESAFGVSADRPIRSTLCRRHQNIRGARSVSRFSVASTAASNDGWPRLGSPVRVCSGGRIDSVSLFHPVVSS